MSDWTEDDVTAGVDSIVTAALHRDEPLSEIEALYLRSDVELVLAAAAPAIAARARRDGYAVGHGDGCEKGYGEGRRDEWVEAAIRKADTGNALLLRDAFPDVWEDLQACYNTPGGRLPIDPVAEGADGE